MTMTMKMKTMTMMNILKTILISGAFALVAASHSTQARACEGEAHAEDGHAGKPSLSLVSSAQAGQSAETRKAVFQVKGMMCQSCEKKIQSSLKNIKGVEGVTFMKPGKDKARLAEVTYAANAKVTPAMLMKAVEEAGYQASEAKAN